MAYLVHASEGGRIEIRESDEPDAVPLGAAFRLAKAMAGWEERVPFKGPGPGFSMLIRTRNHRRHPAGDYLRG